jgi:putative phosphoesterase
MRIGVVSDTHGQVRFTQNAVRMLESLEVEQVLHCGDIGTAAVVELFAAWPTHFVFGNVDDAVILREAIHAAGQTCHERFGTLALAGRKIAFLHGDDSALLDQTIACGDWDMVCHGHTHVARQRRQGRTLVLNPGAVYRANPHSIAIVEFPRVEATVVEIGVGPMFER